MNEITKNNVDNITAANDLPVSDNIAILLIVDEIKVELAQIKNEIAYLKNNIKTIKTSTDSAPGNREAYIKHILGKIEYLKNLVTSKQGNDGDMFSIDLIFIQTIEKKLNNNKDIDAKDFHKLNEIYKKYS
jgi:hypothetical protein